MVVAFGASAACRLRPIIRGLKRRGRATYNGGAPCNPRLAEHTAELLADRAIGRDIKLAATILADVSRPPGHHIRDSQDLSAQIRGSPIAPSVDRHQIAGELRRYRAVAVIVSRSLGHGVVQAPGHQCRQDGHHPGAERFSRHARRHSPPVCQS